MVDDEALLVLVLVLPCSEVLLVGTPDPVEGPAEDPLGPAVSPLSARLEVEPVLRSWDVVDTTDVDDESVSDGLPVPEKQAEAIHVNRARACFMESGARL